MSDTRQLPTPESSSARRGRTRERRARILEHIEERDFVSVKDESAFGEEYVRSIYGAPPTDALLIFGDSGSKR